MSSAGGIGPKPEFDVTIFAVEQQSSGKKNFSLKTDAVKDVCSKATTWKDIHNGMGVFKYLWSKLTGSTFDQKIGNDTYVVDVAKADSFLAQKAGVKLLTHDKNNVKSWFNLLAMPENFLHFVKGDKITLNTSTTGGMKATDSQRILSSNDDNNRWGVFAFDQAIDTKAQRILQSQPLAPQPIATTVAVVRPPPGTTPGVVGTIAGSAGIMPGSTVGPNLQTPPPGTVGGSGDAAPLHAPPSPTAPPASFITPQPPAIPNFGTLLGDIKKITNAKSPEGQSLKRAEQAEETFRGMDLTPEQKKQLKTTIEEAGLPVRGKPTNVLTETLIGMLNNPEKSTNVTVKDAGIKMGNRSGIAEFLKGLE